MSPIGQQTQARLLEGIPLIADAVRQSRTDEELLLAFDMLACLAAMARSHLQHETCDAHGETLSLMVRLLALENGPP